MKHLLILALLVPGALFASQIHAGNVQAGKEKAEQLCASCHGPGGNSTIPMYPVLAGQYADYLYQTLRAYQTGARENPIMAGLVSGLSEQELKNLAAYYAAQDGLTDLSADRK